MTPGLAHVEPPRPETTTVSIAPSAAPATARLLWRSWTWLRELAFIAIGYTCYAWVRDQVGTATDRHDYARAIAHGEEVVAWERHLGLFREGAIQRAVLRTPWVMQALDTFWSYAYLLVTIAVIGWLLARHADRFGPWRTAFFVVTIGAVVIFALFPTAPPRMLPPSYGILDTWNAVGGVAAHDPPRLERISDPLASMPSLHVAWSVWCSIAISSISRRRWVQAAAWAYSLLTIFAVVATGNHYFLDCVAGAALMVAGVYGAQRSGRLHPRART